MFVDEWSLKTLAERMAARVTSGDQAKAQFYAAAQPLLAPALKHLDETPLSAQDASDQRLLHLMLSLAHVSLAIEVQGTSEQQQAIGRQRMIVSRPFYEPVEPVEPPVQY